MFKVATKGGTDLINISDKIEKIIKKSGISDGVVNVFIRHTTAGVVIIENEEGILKDFKICFEKFASMNNHYFHNELQDDDNGSSHFRASMISPSVMIPFKNEKMLLGTWQQVFLVDFDTHSREREVAVSIIEGK